MSRERKLKPGDEKAFCPTVVNYNHAVPLGWDFSEGSILKADDPLIFFGGWDYDGDGWEDRESADYLLVSLLPERYELEPGNVILCELVD